MHDGGAVSSHGLLLDHADELEGAAERSIGVGPFRALKMSHLQNVVILSHKEEESPLAMHVHTRHTVNNVLLWDGNVAITQQEWQLIGESHPQVEKYSRAGLAFDLSCQASFCR